MNHRTLDLLVHPSGQVVLINEGSEPELSVLQRAVGGFIENIPEYYLWEGPVVKHMAKFRITESGEIVEGGITRIYCNEESKLPLYQFLQQNETEKYQEYINENLNPLSYILEPHDFMVGRVIVQLVVKIDD